MDEISVCEIKSVPGLFYAKHALPNDNNIIAKLDEQEWTPVTSSSNSRLVQHYGYMYDYVSRSINVPAQKFPKFIKQLANLLTHICLDYKFNQCIVNNYVPGQGISRHTDVLQYGPVIGCFTINSGAVMLFEKDEQSKELYVQANSLYIMSGETLDAQQKT